MHRNIQKITVPGIGLRKIKSLISVCVAFLVWQIIRFFIPVELEVHPLFGYIYAIVEMRETPEKTKQFSLYRIKATLVGLSMGILLLPLSVLIDSYIGNIFYNSVVNLCLILIGVLATLWIAELVKCKNFCGIAAIIFVICMVRDRDSNANIYIYAILRTVQTIVGVFAAWLVNTYLFHRHEDKTQLERGKRK